MLTSVGFFPWRHLEASLHEVLVTGLFVPGSEDGRDNLHPAALWGSGQACQCEATGTLFGASMPLLMVPLRKLMAHPRRFFPPVSFCFQKALHLTQSVLVKIKCPG